VSGLDAGFSAKGKGGAVWRRPKGHLSEKNKKVQEANTEYRRR